MKRPNGASDDDGPTAKVAKTTKTKHHRLAYKQRGAQLALDQPQDGALIEDQFTRALSVMLYESGFDSVQTQALESLRSHTQEFMHKFALRVKQSMHSSRRDQPLPLDFAQAIAQTGYTSNSFLVDLAHADTASNVAQVPIAPPAPAEPSIFDISSVFGPGDDAGAERTQRWIPRHFPRFPGRHAWKDTPVYTEREQDARRIRERATHEGVLAEQALRKLMAVGKASTRKQARKRDAAAQMEEDVWRETVDALATMESQEQAQKDDGEDTILLGSESLEHEPRHAVRVEDTSTEHGAMVNYDQIYWRKGAGSSVARAR